MKRHCILAIETSCDETAAAVVDSEYGVLSNVLFSQIDLHRKYGGVVPEVASRSHVEKMPRIAHEAILASHIPLKDITAIAVTSGPGLPGSLLVGLTYAKGLAYALRVPLISVNHLAGHLYSPWIEAKPPFPALVLTASGGHTSLYRVENLETYAELATTDDDAAGEALDKVAKLLQLPYPGGPVIEELARECQWADIFSYPRLRHKQGNFSFSGLKTAVLYHLIREKAYIQSEKNYTRSTDHQFTCNVASSLLCAVSDILEERIEVELTKQSDIQSLCFAGGVACNSYIKSQLGACAARHKIPFFAPSKIFCTDNAAMIGFIGLQKAIRSEHTSMDCDLIRW